MNRIFRSMAPIFAALSLTGCATTWHEFNVYPRDGTQVIKGRFVNDWSGTGEVSFVGPDGEKFTGQWTTVAPEVYQTDLSIMVGAVGRTPIAGLTPSFGRLSSNVQFGIASVVGDKGTFAACKYVVNLTGWTTFNTVGACRDSRGMDYVVHGGKRIEEAQNN